MTGAFQGGRVSDRLSRCTGGVLQGQAQLVMDRFLSSATNRIDAKGRVSVPAHFRTIVQKRGYDQLYAVRSLDSPALDVGGPDMLEAFERRIQQEDPFLQTADDMSFVFYGDGAFLKLDQDGRITVTDFIREHTGITDEMAFLGRGHFFQIWEPGRLAVHAGEARERLRALRAAGSGNGSTGSAR